VPRASVSEDQIETSLHLWVVLARAYAAISAHTLDDIKGEGLSGAEFGVLELLFHKGPTLLGEIQRRVLVSSGGITFLVDRLAEKGLVERRECATDRRARFAALTKEGEKLLKRVFPRHARRIADAMSALSVEEQRQVADLIKRLGLGAEAGVDGK
jgi:MarR family 2-MHQ and catechol resistance regulon transcriptional repressor